MTQITATDQILLLLREQLQRGERARRTSIDKGERRAGTPQERVAALAAIKDLAERDFRRALVRGLLSERLGEALTADPAFDAVTGQVIEMIEDAPDARDLLDRVAQEFRKG